MKTIFEAFNTHAFSASLKTLLSLALITLLSNPTMAASTVFKTHDSEGNPVFSDQASEAAEEIQVQTPQTFEPQPRPTFRINDTEAEQPEPGPVYERLSIVSPEHDSAIRNNAGNLTIRLAIEPALQPNHSVQILLDGAVRKTLKTATSAQLQNIDRGTHQYLAQIIDDETGEVLKTSNSVTSTLLRAFRPPRTN